MAVRSTRIEAEVAQVATATTRLTRVEAEVAQVATATTRLTRVGVEVAQAPTATTRLSRLSIMVAVGGQDDPQLRGIRRAGVIHHRQPNAIPRA